MLSVRFRCKSELACRSFHLNNVSQYDFSPSLSRLLEQPNSVQGGAIMNTFTKVLTAMSLVVSGDVIQIHSISIVKLTLAQTAIKANTKPEINKNEIIIC